MHFIMYNHFLSSVTVFYYILVHPGDTGLRGPVGESGVKGTKGDEGDWYCTSRWKIL